MANSICYVTNRVQRSWIKSCISKMEIVTDKMFDVMQFYGIYTTTYSNNQAYNLPKSSRGNMAPRVLWDGSTFRLSFLAGERKKNAKIVIHFFSPDSRRKKMTRQWNLLIISVTFHGIWSDSQFYNFSPTKEKSFLIILQIWNAIRICLFQQ